jgi:hypothetical protein
LLTPSGAGDKQSYRYIDDDIVLIKDRRIAYIFWQGGEMEA